MAEIARNRGHWLMVWCLATFHASLLVVTIIASLHSAGDLGRTLGGLGTLSGIGLYIALWASTFWTTSMWLRRFDILARDWQSDLWRLLGLGVVWGGVNGVIFLLVLALPFARDLWGLIFSVESIIFPLFAYLVGAVIGCLFAMLDAILIGIALRLTSACLPPDARRPPPDDSESLLPS
ncbi:MAG: hypothetical protein ACREJQ_03845 [bacterium]